MADGAADPKTRELWNRSVRVCRTLEGSCESSCWIRDVSTRMVTQLCFVRLELHDRNFVTGAFFSSRSQKLRQRQSLCEQNIFRVKLNRASCEQPVRGTPSEQDLIEAPKLLRASSASRTSSEPDFVRKSFRHGQTFVGERGSSERNFRAPSDQRTPPLYTQPLSRADRRQSRSSVRAEHRQSRTSSEALCQTRQRRTGTLSDGPQTKR